MCADEMIKSMNAIGITSSVIAEYDSKEQAEEILALVKKLFPGLNLQLTDAGEGKLGRYMIELMYLADEWKGARAVEYLGWLSWEYAG